MKRLCALLCGVLLIVTCFPYWLSAKEFGVVPCALQVKHGCLTWDNDKVLIYDNGVSPEEFASTFVGERRGKRFTHTVIGRGKPTPKLIFISDGLSLRCLLTTPFTKEAQAVLYALGCKDIQK